MHKPVLAVLSSAAILVCAGAAEASTIITSTWTGTVYADQNHGDGLDHGAVFGAADADLVGQAFTLTMIVDLDKATTYLATPIDQFEFCCGTSQAALTIDGSTYTPAAAYASYTEGVIAWYDLDAVIGESVGDIASGLVVDSLGASGHLTPDYTLLDNYSGPCNSPCDGYFDVVTATGETQGGLSISSLTINVQSVPEPATWALMIAGFGLAGASLRRRRALEA